MQKTQNTTLHKIMRAFTSSPIKPMQHDANILPLDVKIKRILSRLAIRAIRNVSPKNLIRRQANSDRPAETGLEQLFTKTKQMEGMDDNIYWRKRPP
jgi:hypothetical protein